MKETIVYLPMPHRVPDSAGLPSDQAYTPLEVFEALDTAGIKWVQEDPKDYQIRMMKLQIEELKAECTRRGDCNASLAKKLDGAIEENSSLKQAYLELQDQNAALKMTLHKYREGDA